MIILVLTETRQSEIWGASISHKGCTESTLFFVRVNEPLWQFAIREVINNDQIVEVVDQGRYQISITFETIQNGVGGGY